MPRRPSFLPALAVAAGVFVTLPGTLVGTLAGTGGAAAAAPARHVTQRPAEDAAPLGVTISSLSPSVVPRSGPVRVSGTVTNDDDVTWARINLYPFIGQEPIRSPAALREAAAGEPDQLVGDRITEPGPYATIDELAPGESATYTVRVPRSRLDLTTPGVYWFGVHALGEGGEPRDENADGRARTFLPLVGPREDRQVDTALVAQVRREVTHNDDGSLAGVGGWTKALSGSGRLDRVVGLGAAAGSRPLTWLVDPAVPDAVRQLVAGNPPRSLSATVVDADDPTSPSPSSQPSAGGDQPSPDADGVPAADRPTRGAIADGAAWLDRLRRALEGSEILALPYGDVDVAGAGEHDPALYTRARRRSGTELQPWGLRTTPAVASPTGYLDAEGLRAVEKDTTVLVTDAMFPGRAPSVVETLGHRLVVSSSGAAAGGPAPGDPLTGVALRQRVLSEAALRLLSDQRPLVVLLPTDWAPTDAAAFFRGLGVDWLRLTTVADVAADVATAVPAEGLRYPERQQRRELGSESFAAADDLISAGETLQNLLTDNDEVASGITGQALSSVSYAARAHRRLSRLAAERSQGWVEARLAQVRISAPRQVTLSSGSGRFAVTLANTLAQPTTVRVAAFTDTSMEVSTPPSVDLAPHSRTTVLLTAATKTQGLHNVRLLVTDTDGTPLGSSDDLPIRSAQVSGVIWLILGSGAALLVVAIGVRLFRRIRAARAA